MVYLPTLMVDFMVHVGKYISYMDSMGYVVTFSYGII